MTENEQSDRNGIISFAVRFTCDPFSVFPEGPSEKQDQQALAVLYMADCPPTSASASHARNKPGGSSVPFTGAEHQSGGCFLY